MGTRAREGHAAETEKEKGEPVKETPGGPEVTPERSAAAGGRLRKGSDELEEVVERTAERLRALARRTAAGVGAAIARSIAALRALAARTGTTYDRLVEETRSVLTGDEHGRGRRAGFRDPVERWHATVVERGDRPYGHVEYVLENGAALTSVAGRVETGVFEETDVPMIEVVDEDEEEPIVVQIPLTQVRRVTYRPAPPTYGPEPST